MRDLIARLCHAVNALITERTAARHSAAYFAAPAAPTAAHRTSRPVPNHVLERSCPLDGEEIALIRPYVMAHEAEREHRLQRERRTAAVLASFDIDYDIETAVA